MRLLTLTIDFLPESGGLARYADSLARVFAHDMTVVADVQGNRAACRKLQAEAPYTLRYEAFMRCAFPRWRGAFRVLREERPDVIIVHHVLPLGTVAWLYGLFAQTPFVVCLHGMDLPRQTSDHGSVFCFDACSRRRTPSLPIQKLWETSATAYRKGCARVLPDTVDSTVTQSEY